MTASTPIISNNRNPKHPHIALEPRLSSYLGNNVGPSSRLLSGRGLHLASLRKEDLRSLRPALVRYRVIISCTQTHMSAKHSPNLAFARQELSAIQSGERPASIVAQQQPRSSLRTPRLPGRRRCTAAGADAVATRDSCGCDPSMQCAARVVRLDA